MARIYMEGFEDGLPNTDYIQGNLDVVPYYNIISGLSLNGIPNYTNLGTGRNAYSQKSLYMTTNLYSTLFIKTLPSTYSELYARAYFKASGNGTTPREILYFTDISNNKLFGLYMVSTTGSSSPISYNFDIYAKVGGSYAKQGSTINAAMIDNTWYCVEIYYKIDSSVGAYEVKIDKVSISSGSSLNTGTTNIAKFCYGNGYASAINITMWFDDIAVNDTSGSSNNSWCGYGTIVGLKPKGVGNSSQWDTSQGWVKAESGTTTTNIKITAHGLSDNDVIYNATRDAYRLVTVVDVDNLTVSSVTSQTTDDVIVAFTKGSTIAATTNTSTSRVVLAGNPLKTYDVFVNTTRSNAIRRVIYINGTSAYNSLSTAQESGTVVLGSTVTSQASGDSIDCYSVKQYPITNHWEAVSTTYPNPSYSNITSTTLNDIDLFDMQELVADKSIPSSAVVNALSVNVVAQENGSGSQYKPVLRSSGSNDEGTTVNLSVTTNHLEYQSIYDASPFTSSAWTVSEVDGIEAGVKLV